MVVLSDKDYDELKEQLRNDIVSDLFKTGTMSLNKMSIKERRKIFDRYFPETMEMQIGRRCRIKQAITTATNVLRSRTMGTSCYVDRYDNVCSADELNELLDVYEKVCAAFREIYREDRKRS